MRLAELKPSLFIASLGAALLLALTLFLLAWRTGMGGISAYKSNSSTMMLGFPEWIIYTAMVPPMVLTGVIGLAQTFFGDKVEKPE